MPRDRLTNDNNALLNNIISSLKDPNHRFGERILIYGGTALDHDNFFSLLNNYVNDKYQNHLLTKGWEEEVLGIINTEIDRHLQQNSSTKAKLWQRRKDNIEQQWRNKQLAFFEEPSLSEMQYGIPISYPDDAPQAHSAPPPADTTQTAEQETNWLESILGKRPRSASPGKKGCNNSPYCQ